MSRTWTRRLSAGLALPLAWWSLAAHADANPACKSLDLQLPPAVVERWVARQVPPTQLLDALARASSSAVRIDEIAISAGRGLVKGHVDAGDRNLALAGLVQRLQQVAAVRRAPSVTWLDDRGVPSAEPVAPGFLLHLEGEAPVGRAAGRSALPCEMVDPVLANIAGVAPMNGAMFQRFLPRRELSLEDGLPILSIEATVSGTFAALRSLMLDWEALPYAIALDGVVVAPVQDQLEVGLTIKVVRGAARVGGNLVQRTGAGDVQDPFRVTEKVLAARRAASPLPACGERAKAWELGAGGLSYRGVFPAPGAQVMGLFRVSGFNGFHMRRIGDAIAEAGARVVAIKQSAVELEIAEMVGDECQLRRASLPASGN